MITKIFSCITIGLQSHIIEVEVHLQHSPLPKFIIVGLTDIAIQEAKERVTSAIKNAGAVFPLRKKVINLAPADLHKQGPSFDLSIAVGILEASDQIKIHNRSSIIFIGELALDGTVRSCNGILPITANVQKRGFREIFLPFSNVKEASLVKNIIIRPVQNLSDIMLHFTGEKEIEPFCGDADGFFNDTLCGANFSEIRGQEHAKRSLEIAAAGKHNILLLGPPGSGKTMLARSFPSILPSLSLEEALEVSTIYSVAGLLSEDKPLISHPPFRAVHHTTSSIALVGGGSIPKPGEISLAHHGVLFLDEIAEFSQKALEVLRQPLQDKTITISRASHRMNFPADFILIAAKNPCPCGYSGDKHKVCQCSPMEFNRYEKKISGPLLDRIDLHVEVPRLAYEKLSQKRDAESSEDIACRVLDARKVQIKRQKVTNSHLSPKQLRSFVELTASMEALMRQAVDNFHLSPRMYFKILKVARTIADLEKLESVQEKHLAEALQYRSVKTIA